jgi:hypothetical protein
MFDGIMSTNNRINIRYYLDNLTGSYLDGRTVERKEIRPQDGAFLAHMICYCL